MDNGRDDFHVVPRNHLAQVRIFFCAGYYTAKISSCMRILFRYVLALPLMAAFLGCAAFGATTEKGAFEAAEQAFRDLAYGRAENELAGFIERYTNSTRLPEAVLMQAQARLFQSNYVGAIELLSASLPQSG